LLSQPRDTFAVTGPSGATTGEPYSFTVTAQLPGGGTDISYRGTVHFTSSDGGASLPADYTFTTGDQGSHAFTALFHTLGSQSLTAADNNNGIIGSLSGILVSAPQASSFVVTGYPSPVGAGEVNTFTVSAIDDNGFSVTDYAGTVHFTSSDGRAILPVDYTFTTADHGSRTFGAVVRTAGTESLTATDSLNSVTGSQEAIVVNPGQASTFVVTGFPSSTVAGQVGAFTVTAADAYGNAATSYTGTVRFGSSDGSATLPANYTFIADDQGTHTFAAALKTAGTQSLTATDTVTASIAGSQQGIVVNAGTAHALLLTGLPSSIRVGQISTFTVQAVDAYGNVVSGYQGTVHFSSSDHKANLPANYTFTAADSGRHTFGASFRTRGRQTIQVTDTRNPELTVSVVVNVLDT
jgi:hypothetical protein